MLSYLRFPCHNFRTPSYFALHTKKDFLIGSIFFKFDWYCLISHSALSGMPLLIGRKERWSSLSDSLISWGNISHLLFISDLPFYTHFTLGKTQSGNVSDLKFKICIHLTLKMNSYIVYTNWDSMYSANMKFINTFLALSPSIKILLFDMIYPSCLLVLMTYHLTILPQLSRKKYFLFLCNNDKK